MTINNFNEIKNFSGVQFQEKKPLLEAELNELQSILKSRGSKLSNLLVSEGISPLSAMTYTNGTLTVKGAKAFLDNEILNITNLTLALAEGESAYLSTWELEVGSTSTLKEYGNEQGTTTPNTVIDSRIGGETSKRLVRKYNLVKSNSASDRIYLKLGTVVNGAFVVECEPIQLNKDIIENLGANSVFSEYYTPTSTGMTEINTISGNTLQNLMPTRTLAFTKTDATAYNFKQVECPLLRPSTTYTVILNISKNPNTITDKLSLCFVLGTSIGSTADKRFTNTTGKQVFTLTTVANPNNLVFSFRMASDTNGSIGDYEATDIMVLEGDWTNKPIPPYFEGIRSVNEGEILPSKDLSAQKSGSSPGITIATSSTGIKQGTTYTVTYTKVFDGFTSTGTNGILTAIKYTDGTWEYLSDKGLEEGYYIGKFRTKTDVAIEKITVGKHEQATGNFTIDNCMLFEGDYTNYPINAETTIVKSVGKNLLPITATTTMVNGLTFTVNADKTITVNGTATASGYFEISRVDVRLPINVYATVENFTGDLSVIYAFKDGTFQYNTGAKTIYSPLMYVRLSYTSGKTYSNLTYKVQIEQGTTATAYEPYTEDIITLPKIEPLRRLPTGVCDTIDFDRGIITRNIGKVVLNGSETWGLNSTWSGGNMVARYSSLPLRKQGTTNIINDKLPVTGCVLNESNQCTNEFLIGEVNTNNIYISILKSKLSTQDLVGFTSWLQANPITVYYQLATPIVEPINLPKNRLQSFKGGLIITEDTLIKPSEINILPPDTIGDRLINLEKQVLENDRDIQSNVLAIVEANNSILDLKNTTAIQMAEVNDTLSQHTEEIATNSLDIRTNTSEIINIKNSVIQNKPIVLTDDVPVGSIVVRHSTSTTPSNWLLCDGSSKTIADYPELYEVLGTTYGGTTTTFNLPNIGSGESLVALSESGGDQVVTLLPNEKGFIKARSLGQDMQSVAQEWESFKATGGDIGTLRLFKLSPTIDVIGTFSNNLELGVLDEDGELKLGMGMTAQTNALAPWNVSKDLLALGTENNKFKDLYLTGIGSVATAITDRATQTYGGWTPVLYSSEGSSTKFNITNISSWYTRVGNLLIANFNFRVDGVGSATVTNTILVKGLPFVTCGKYNCGVITYMTGIKDLANNGLTLNSHETADGVYWIHYINDTTTGSVKGSNLTLGVTVLRGFIVATLE